jgi:ribosomal protein L7Ae-like RNA K-turn-binding protein
VATNTRGNPPPQQQLKKYHPGTKISNISNYFGLAMKAGMVAAGDIATQKALKAGEAYLLVLALNISPVVAKELISLTEKRHLPLLWWPDKESLGFAVGKSQRGALAILDKGFCEAILKICEESFS